MTLKVINLLGSPGAGKSTTAAGLFFDMKLAGHRVELITEYAKDLVYEQRMGTLQNQVYVFGHQVQRLERLRDKVEWVITDSPIILSSIYAPKDYPESFHNLVKDIWHKFENYVIMLKRVVPYQEFGRYHTEEDSYRIDSELRRYLQDNGIIYTNVDGTPEAPRVIREVLTL